jgi:hypothetical protein
MQTSLFMLTGLRVLQLLSACRTSQQLQSEATSSTPSHYDFRPVLSQGRAAVGQNGRYGFINREDEEVMPPPLGTCVLLLSEKLAAVQKQGQKQGHWSWINPAGRLVLPCQYASAGELDNGRAMVRTDERLVPIGREGQLLTEREQ